MSKFFNIVYIYKNEQVMRDLLVNIKVRFKLKYVSVKLIWCKCIIEIEQSFINVNFIYIKMLLDIISFLCYVEEYNLISIVLV